jgi:hypothetical protein
VPIYEFPPMPLGRYLGRLVVAAIPTASVGKEDVMTTASQPADRLRVTSTAAALSSIGSKLQKALIFEVVAILGNSAAALALIGTTYAMATQDRFTGANLFFGYLADGMPAALFAAAAVLTVVVAIRTWKMLTAANSGDVAATRQLSSPGWAVVAILASWVVPGITLRKVNAAIKELQAEAR